MTNLYNSPLLRIGKSIRTIPEDYKTFFNTKNRELFREETYSPKVKMVLHLNEGILPTDRLLLIEGLGEVNGFSNRFRFLLKWGHFVWRLSDLRAVQLTPTRVIKPEGDSGSLEMKVHWQLKVASTLEGCKVLYADGEQIKISLGSLLQVQYHRFFPKPITSTSESTTAASARVLYTGITRYVFDKSNGLCREVHVERVEPRISGVEWKWRVAKGSEVSQVT